MPKLEEWWNLPAFSPFFQGQKQNGNGQQSGRYGYTGSGSDNAIQPKRRVPGVGNGTYDGHEGEFIFDANATQAIGPDVLESIRQGAKAGQVDPNSLRQAIGQPQKKQMYVGGFSPSAVIGRALDKTSESIASFGSSVANAANTQTSGAAMNEARGAGYTPEAILQREAVTPTRVNPYGNDRPNPGEQTSGAAMNGARGAGYTPEAIAERDAQNKPVADNTVTNDTVTTDNTATTDDSPVRNEAIDYLRGIMKGDNAAVRNMYNQYLQDIGGAGAAASAAAKSEMARAGLGKEAIATGMSSLRRDISSNVSQAAGTMAGKSLEQAQAAAKDLEIAGRWDKEWGAETTDRMLNDVTSLVNANAPFDVVNAAFKKHTGRDMTQEEYSQMQTATSFGTTMFGREKGLADQLIEQGGIENITQAGEIYADLYPGVGIDWSTVINADNSARFSTAMGELGKIVATAGNDIEEAMELISSSGLGASFDALGIDTWKLEKLYQGLTVNKIDEEWKAIEGSDAYQSLVVEDPEFAAELKELWARNKLGVEEMTISDKYNIVDANGNILASVAGEDAATTKAEELGGTAVKTGKKTMVLTDNESGTSYGGSVDIPKGTKQGDVWLDNGIAYEFDAELGATPTTFTEPFDRVADKLYEMGPTIGDEKNPYYEDIVNARAAAYVSGNVRLNPGDLSADDPVYQRILNDVSITKGIGSSEIDKSGVQSGEHHYFTTFQPFDRVSEIPQGTLLNIDGKLWSYAGSKEDKIGGYNRKWYFLTDMATGEKYVVRAQGDRSETTPRKQ